MSEDEAKMWQDAAAEITPAKNLARIHEHTKFVIASVGTIGTLLAGAGGITAAISINRTTLYWGEVPVVPVGALLTSVLAGVAVAIALFGRRPTFTLVNPERLEEVEKWYVLETERRKAPVRLSSLAFIAAAATAVATAGLAGIIAVADPATVPMNLSSLSATVGDKGVVTVALSGAVERLDEEEHLIATVTANQDDETDGAVGSLVDTHANPSVDGRASLDLKAQAPVGSSSATATVTVLNGEAVVDEWELIVTYPEVPEPETAKTDGGGAEVGDALTAAVPAVAELLGHFLKTGGELPSALSKALEVLDIAGWVKDQQELLAGGELSPDEIEVLQVVHRWERAARIGTRFERHVGVLFVWSSTHGRIPHPSVDSGELRIGKWVLRQRARYGDGVLRPRQIALLESVPGWSWD